MPELPEVETTRRGISPHVIGKKIQTVIIRQPQLRWPVPGAVKQKLQGETFIDLTRRGKYLLFTCSKGTLIIHLGMSGSLRMVGHKTALSKHDHVDILFSDGLCLRLRDPRRFGAVLWTDHDPLQHELLKNLGPEPLSAAFQADYLFKKSRRRKQAIKLFIMDSHIVVGVGNIYANEALFLANIRPAIAAGRISKPRLQQLVSAIKQTLEAAIQQGGTTLRDFTAGDGQPGYFQQHLNVYKRQNQPCCVCGTTIKLIRLGQRATYYCPKCQH